MFCSMERETELNYFRNVLLGWAGFNRAQIMPVDSRPGWDSLRAVYDEGAPELSIF